MKKIFILFGLLIASQLWAQNEQGARNAKINKIAPARELGLNEMEVVNIEHAALQAYMADSTYHYNDDIDLTVITKYANREVYGTNLDHPQGKRLSWTRAAEPDEIAEIRITLSENEDLSDSLTYRPSQTDATSYTVHNLFPNRVYYYRAEEYHHDGSVALLEEGAFRTVGQVRMMRVEGASNVRDIGGWQTQFGKRIKYGILYRSGHMDKVSEAGKQDFVRNMGVTAELDLRGLFRREPHLSHSMLSDSVVFTRIVADSYGLSSQRAVYARCLNWIVERLKEGRSVNWHCGVGCDRCGTLSFLIEGVLGVSEVDLCRDYELSCFRGHKRYRGHVGFRKMLPMIKRLGHSDDLAECFYNYWVESGVPALNIEYLRTVMLEQN